MPELPEVETVVRTLRPRLVGSIIRAVRLERADILDPLGTDLAAHLVGRSVTTVERRGKRIIVALDNAERFYIHLGMTGQLTVVAADEPLRNHTHLVLELAGEAKMELRFRDPRRFGGIWWLGQAGSDEGMGPEPLTIRPAQLAERLKKTRRAIKVALLDQSIIAGLGNIYVDESLFIARIHPLVPANRITTAQVARLNRAIKLTLRKAIHHRGSTLRDYRDADGEAGGYQSRHAVYGREGEPCVECKTPIRRIVLGGRSTHFCLNCQRKRG
jgi:formamidopyrimidine-DNA glycosylase